MKSIFVCFLGVCVLIDTARSGPYYLTTDIQNHGRICHPNESMTLDDGYWKFYGIVYAENYYLNSTCNLNLSAPHDYHIMLRFMSMEIDCYQDALFIGDKQGTEKYCGCDTPDNSIDSKTNYYTFKFITGNYISECMRGFNIVYTAFHYGECSSREFKCPNDDRCILSEVVCDSYDNCGDWSDETIGTCGLPTDTVMAISVTFSLAGISCIVLVIRRYRRKSRHQRRESSSRNSVPATPSEPEPNMEPEPITEPVPISTIQLIEPPKYVDAPPSYTDIYSNPAVDGVYETSNSDNGVDPPPTYESAVTHPCETNT